MPPDNEADEQKSLQALGLSPEILTDPSKHPSAGNDKKVAEDPVWSTIATPDKPANDGAGQQSPLELGLYPTTSQQPPPVGALPDVVGLANHGPLTDDETVTLPSGTTVHNNTVRLSNGLTAEQTTVTIPGHAPKTSTLASQGISYDQIGGLFGTDDSYSAADRDRDLALVSGRYQGPVSEEARNSAQNRLNAHWQRGGLWLADGSTILPDAVYGTGQLAQDLALASTEGSLDPQSEERRRQAQERLAAHRYSLAAQNADQVEARYLDMTPVSPERQARLDDLVASGVPASQAEEVLLQRSIAARIRLQHAGIPIDYAVGDRLEQQGMMAPSSEFVPPSLVLTAPSNADGAEGGAPIGPETVYNALVPSSPSMALQLAIPGLLRGISTIAPETAAAVLQSALGASAAGSQSVAIPALGSGLEPTASGTGAVGGLGAAVILGTVMSLVIANGGVPVQPMGQSPLVAPGKDSEDVPSVNVPWSQQGVNPWTTGRPGPVPTEQVPGTATVAPPVIDADPADGLRGDPAAPAPVGPSPTEDPLTVSNPVSFPSAKPGQPNVPVEGTYWEGNYLKWGAGNPEGKRPNTYASKGTGDLKLRAQLFELGVWTLDDIDEAERPAILAAMARLDLATANQDLHRGFVQIFANIYGIDAAKLLGSKAESKEELLALAKRGLPTDVVKRAIDNYWKAQVPVDRAKEALGEAGAVALLRSDGWTVNVRPTGAYTHDVVAVKNGQVMVVEAKGGNPGRPRPGDAMVPDGPGSDTGIRAEQVTDPYLWGKLKEDAAGDPVFKQWLIDQGVWDAIENEDPSRVGYRLSKTDTDLKTTVYGSTQEEVNGGVPGHTVTGRTTGNPDGGPPAVGPTLHGIAEVVPPTGDLLGRAGSWWDDLVRGRLRDLAALSNLAVPVDASVRQRVRRPVDESLTVTLVPSPVAAPVLTQQEHLRCLSYQ